MTLRVFLVGDGSSDRVLRYPCEWLLRELGFPASVLFLPAPVGTRRLDLKIVEALKSRPDLLLVHRDAEREPWRVRREEIQRAVDSAQEARGRAVALIPVRMTEAWFLIDEPALRKASGNPNGKGPLNMPNLGSLEQLADPKEVLYENFRLASGLRGRHLRSLSVSRCVHRLAELISDYSPLRSLSAFQSFQAELKAFLARFSQAP